MATSKAILKSWFETGDKPTAEQFAALIDSFIHSSEDSINVAMVQGLSQVLANKASATQLNAVQTAMGALADLQTTDKTSLVAAINQLVTSLGDIDPVFSEGFTVNFPNNTTGTPNGYVVSAGDRIDTYLKTQARKATPPVYTPPSGTISSNPAAGSYELGTNLNLTLSTSFSKQDAGALTGTVINKNGSFLANGAANDAIQITGSTISYQAVFSYAEGEVENDSLGDPYPAGHILAGSVNSNTLSFTGFRKAFVGFVFADGSAAIRAFPISKNNPANGTVIDIPIPAGAQRVSIVYPATLKDLSQVLYVEDSNKNITGNFVKRSGTTDVEGANGYAAIACKVYDYIPVEPFPAAANYKATI